ncbi:hypothetical protein H5410_063488 [Solanum commersonii]|uniref:Uncharacterized protein n=1 Tax=Solanum commersonii TaxID=4109 RepID=A0A9J5WDN0_SOLCO|nr:hypothetical protein H5410_063488 [Solanum commersonii]
MAATNDFISEINNKSMYWKLKVSIVGLWENTDRDRPDCPFSIEVILMDEKRRRIHVSLGGSLFPNLEKAIVEEIEDPHLISLEVVSYGDVRNKNISTTFWGDFVDQIKPYLNESNDKPIVVVMQLIRSH